MTHRLRLSVVLEVTADLALLAWVLYSGKAFLFPTAAGRLLLMGFLGIRGLQGRQWARWCFGAVLASTVLAGAVVSFYTPGRGLREGIAWPPVAVSALYSLLLWLALSGRVAANRTSSTPSGI
jgi:hypothetical protein